MSSNSVIAYVVYSPPYKGLPFLAVTLNPDGSVVAKQFDSEEAANDYRRQMAKGGYPSGARH